MNDKTNKNGPSRAFQLGEAKGDEWQGIKKATGLPDSAGIEWGPEQDGEASGLEVVDNRSPDRRIVARENLRKIKEYLETLKNPKHRQVVKATLNRMIDGRDTDVIEGASTNLNLELRGHEPSKIRHSVAEQFGIKKSEVDYIWRKHLEPVGASIELKPHNLKRWKEPEWKKPKFSWPVDLKGRDLEDIDVVLDYHKSHVDAYFYGQDNSLHQIKPNQAVRMLYRLASLGHGGERYRMYLGYGDKRQASVFGYPNQKIIEPTTLHKLMARQGWSIPPIDIRFETRKDPVRRWLISGKEVMAVNAEWIAGTPRYTEREFELIQAALVLWWHDVYVWKLHEDEQDFRLYLVYVNHWANSHSYLQLPWFAFEPFDFNREIDVSITTYFEDIPTVRHRHFGPDTLADTLNLDQSKQASRFQGPTLAEWAVKTN